MNKWNKILLLEEYSPEEPDRVAVTIAKMLKKRKNVRVLDLGCGAGRHVLYMTAQGFETCGLDLSETGLKKTKERLEKRRLEAFLVKGDMKLLPFIDSYFNAVICLNTIYHQRFEEIEQTISEVYRTLDEKGLFLVNFHTKRSHRYGVGVKVEENTFMDEDGPEKEVVHHFVDENELKQLLKDFRIIRKWLDERRTKNYLASRWEILAEKR